MGIIIGLLLIILFILIFIFPYKIIDLFENTGFVEFSLEKNGTKKLTTVRLLSLTGICVIFIFMTGSLQIIGGFIGMIIGFIAMKYSLKIHNIIGSGTWFRGDDGIKLAGLIILIVSSLWIVGFSQQLLQNFTNEALRK